MPFLSRWIRRRLGMLTRAGYFMLGASWWAVAQAQQVVTAQSGVAYDMSQIAPQSWFYVVMAAGIGGMAKLLGDLPSLELKGWRTAAELSAGMFLSVVTGLVLYLLILVFIPDRAQPSGPLVCVIAFLGGMGGKRTLDEILKRMNKEIAERTVP